MNCRVVHDLQLSQKLNQPTNSVVTGACLQCYYRPYTRGIKTTEGVFSKFFYAIFGFIQGISKVDLVAGSSEVFSFLYPCSGYILARSSQRTLQNISDPIKYMYSKSTSTKESK